MLTFQGIMGMIKPTTNIRDIARIAGVSVASVSRALKSEPSSKLSEKQRRHILDICAKLHYCPNEHTRRLFSRRANTAAIFFPPFGKISEDTIEDYIDMNFGACLMGAQSTLRKYGIDLLLTEITSDFLASKRYLTMIRGKVLDGILLWGALEQDEYIQEILHEGIPAVMLQTRKTSCECTMVTADDYGGMKLLTERVLAAGHRKIAVARPPEESSTGRERLAGIVETLQKQGIRPVYVTEQGGYGYYFGRASAREILEHAPDVTCIMNSNDMAAFGSIDELLARGLSVPADLSVTGADGLKLPGRGIRIDSFFSPAFEIGRCGAEELCRQISGKTDYRNICLPVTSVKGETVRDINHTGRD